MLHCTANCLQMFPPLSCINGDDVEYEIIEKSWSVLQNWAEGDTLDSLTSHGSIQIRATPRQGLISLNLLYSCFKKEATLSHTKSSAPLISQPAVLACYLLRYYPFISICLSVCLSIYPSIILHYPEQGAVLPVRFRSLFVPSRVFQRESLELSWFQGKLLVHSEVSVWCWHWSLSEQEAAVLILRKRWGLCNKHSSGMNSGTELPLAPHPAMASVAEAEPTRLWAVIHPCWQGPAQEGRQCTRLWIIV